MRARGERTKLQRAALKDAYARHIVRRGACRHKNKLKQKLNGP